MVKKNTLCSTTFFLFPSLLKAFSLAARKYDCARLTISRINLLPWDIQTHFAVRYHTQNNSVKVTIQKILN